MKKNLSKIEGLVLRQSLTLIEVMIALSLGTIIISILFSSFHNLSSQQRELEVAHKIINQRSVAFLKLSQIFDQLILDGISLENEKKTTNFYTDSSSQGPILTFQYYNPLDRNPDFAKAVDATLFLDARKQLCLTSTAKSHTREEFLFENIEKIEFQFLDPEEKKWCESWNKKNRSFPVMFKIILTEKKFLEKTEKVEYSFIIKNHPSQIVYKL
ncbi:MAG: hypothetical protein L0207_01250 [Chlamydiae bacterium]|nr:hypothetical protein [Chlamydiota bacterium]